MPPGSAVSGVCVGFEHPILRVDCLPKSLRMASSSCPFVLIQLVGMGGLYVYGEAPVGHAHIARLLLMR